MIVSNVDNEAMEVGGNNFSDDDSDDDDKTKK